jgi:hypothetical protein
MLYSICPWYRHFSGLDRVFSGYDQIAPSSPHLTIHRNIMKNKSYKVIAKQCPPLLTCPAILDDGSDSFIVIGKILDSDEMDSISKEIGNNETAVKIPKALLSLPNTDKS